jgi:hypothetical protein
VQRSGSQAQPGSRALRFSTTRTPPHERAPVRSPLRRPGGALAADLSCRRAEFDRFRLANQLTLSRRHVSLDIDPSHDDVVGAVLLSVVGKDWDLALIVCLLTNCRCFLLLLRPNTIQTLECATSGIPGGVGLVIGNERLAQSAQSLLKQGENVIAAIPATIASPSQGGVAYPPWWLVKSPRRVILATDQRLLLTTRGNVVGGNRVGKILGEYPFRLGLTACQSKRMQSESRP